MQLIPAVDLLEGRAVRLRRGDYDEVVWESPAEDWVNKLVDGGAERLHLVNLDGARSGRIDSALIARLTEVAAPIPCQVAGGVRSIDDAQTLLDAGADRVIVGTAALAAPDILARCIHELGNRLVVALDVRDGYLAIRGWTESSKLSFANGLAACRQAGVERVMCTAIHRDGTLQGPDLTAMGEAVASGIPVIAAGGIRSVDDLIALEGLGSEAAVSGLAIAQGLLTPSGR